MERYSSEEKQFPEEQKKQPKGRAMLFIIIACWLLFYLYTGSKGGVG
jgi:hypothetical protein